MTSTASHDSIVSSEQMQALLAAHAAWLANGRNGEGRLALRDTTVGASIEDADLRYAEFDGVRLAGISLVRSRLDGARILRSSLEKADLRHCSLIETRFEDCDLRRAMVAGAAVAKTGFLRSRFGDYGSQPIGKPDVKGAYAIVAPDFSHAGDGSRIGNPAELDARWFTPPNDGVGRRFVFDSATGSAGGGRYVALVLHMYVAWSREVGPRFQDRVGYQSFGQFLAEGAPAPWSDALPRAIDAKLRETVGALVSAWTPDSVSVS